MLNIENPEKYSAALYLRLSKEDEKSGESGSIINQRELLEEFAKKNDIKVFDIYTDDGFSGTNFNRPAFMRMIRDIEQGLVNMVITKDLSRLGRNYVEVGGYIEDYFPEKNVRYIALNDSCDSAGEDDVMPFKNILNEFYAKDISRKICCVKHYKQNHGLYIGSRAPFGYKKDKTDKNRLLIDEKAAKVVKRIFMMAYGGRTANAIAAQLNSEHIAPPSAFGVKDKTEIGVWSASYVSDMLRNETYIGNMVQGKARKISYKSKKVKKIPRRDWIVIPNTHEAIVGREIFDAVNLSLDSRVPVRQRKYSYPLKGIIFCAECKSPLGIVNRIYPENGVKTDHFYFVCRRYQHNSSCCSSHTVKERIITDIVLEFIRKRIKSCDTQRIFEISEETAKRFAEKSDIFAQRKILKKKAEIIESNLITLYEDRLSGIITAEEYRTISERKRGELRLCMEKIRAAAAEEEKYGGNLGIFAADAAEKFLRCENFNAEIIGRIIERIELSGNKQLVIRFR
ncbi:MAG: recombinase family protein [Firmicutes bacterium]|nr:recombinase family protein [Bacillota bacterium]